MRSPVPFEPLSDCTASSRMRCSASVIVASAPSAVWASEMPSLALRIATLMPRTCVFMRSAIARPAASSFAELTRRPEDRRCIEVASDACEVLRLRCAFSEATLVLIVCGMECAPEEFGATTGVGAGHFRRTRDACLWLEFFSGRLPRIRRK